MPHRKPSMSEGKINGITKEAWLAVESPKDRDSLLFDMIAGIYERQKSCVEKQDKNRVKNMSIAAGSGFVGGFVAMLTKMAFWK